MKIRVPFHYNVSYTPYRAQNSRSALFASETEIEIREVAPKDAPVAFLVSCDTSHRFAPLGPEKRPRSVLAHDGKFWRELGAVEELAAALTAGNDQRSVGPFDICSHLLGIPRYPGSGAHTAKVTDEQWLRRQNPRPMREYQDDRGARMARTLALRALDVMSVDGIAYVREYEPCFVLESRFNDITLTVSTAPANPCDPFRNAYEQFDYPLQKWNALRFDEARDEAVRRAETKGGRAVDGGFINVLMPELVLYADGARSVTKAAQDSLGSLRQKAAALTRSEAVAMFALRDALDQWTGLPQASPQLVEALRLAAALPIQNEASLAARAALPGGLRDNRGKSFADKATEALKFTAEARTRAAAGLSRWDNPLDGLSWEHLAMGSRFACEDDLHEVLSFDSARVIGQALDTDLSDWALVASRGEARLLVHGTGSTSIYAPSDQWKAAILVAFTPEHGAQVVGTAARNADAPADEIVRSACRQIEEYATAADDLHTGVVLAPAS